MVYCDSDVIVCEGKRHASFATKCGQTKSTSAHLAHAVLKYDGESFKSSEDFCVIECEWSIEIFKRSSGTTVSSQRF